MPFRAEDFESSASANCATRAGLPSVVKNWRPPMKQAKTRRGTETRDRILTSAAELIHERAVAGTSVDDILAASETG